MNKEKYKKIKELVAEIDILKSQLRSYKSFNTSGRNLYITQSGGSSSSYTQPKFTVFLKEEYINLGKLFKTYIKNLEADIEKRETILKNL